MSIRYVDNHHQYRMNSTLRFEMNKQYAKWKRNIVGKA
jgi:hypothetical protein